ncbi:GAF domain-containing sensor histidine kinase [Catalinimonas sp. 4WD22]|uniref:GAF domain-containing sensor histidine kinase n=1 Tax=Catalinimonas locisalis TaxID=3133978 RepID=UPI00310166C1
MINSNKLLGEPQRLEAVKRYKILDTPPEKEFDELVKLASMICNAPISLISLLEKERQWFKAKVGVHITETPIELSFCSHAIQSDDVLIVNDAREDVRFANNPFVVNKPNIRFYAGMPLITPDGFRLGTLCVIDTVPRTLSEDQIFSLQVLGRQVIQQLELKLHVRDLTKSIGKIHRQNKELNRLNQVSNKLISIISHDLRSPLTSLKGFLELFNEKQISPKESIDFSRGISKLLDSSLNLMENLIQWGVTQIEENRMIVQPLRLDTILNETIHHQEYNTAQKNNNIINHISQPYQLLGDADMIRFMIRNLLQNANKFTQSGTIEISVSQTEDFHQINIKDNGVGMKGDLLHKLFHWDERVSLPGSKGEKGAGLGLLICKEFAEKHGGSLKVESTYQKGSIFSFTIYKYL